MRPVALDDRRACVPRIDHAFAGGPVDAARCERRIFVEHERNPNAGVSRGRRAAQPQRERSFGRVDYHGEAIEQFESEPSGFRRFRTAFEARVRVWNDVRDVVLNDGIADPQFAYACEAVVVFGIFGSAAGDVEIQALRRCGSQDKMTAGIEDEWERPLTVEHYVDEHLAVFDTEGNGRRHGTMQHRYRLRRRRRIERCSGWCGALNDRRFLGRDVVVLDVDDLPLERPDRSSGLAPIRIANRTRVLVQPNDRTIRQSGCTIEPHLNRNAAGRKRMHDVVRATVALKRALAERCAVAVRGAPSASLDPCIRCGNRNCVTRVEPVRRSGEVLRPAHRSVGSVRRVKPILRPAGNRATGIRIDEFVEGTAHVVVLDRTAHRNDRGTFPSAARGAGSKKRRSTIRRS